MVDVLILEDDPEWHRDVGDAIPSSLAYEIVVTSAGLRDKLTANPELKFFILDDNVPDVEDGDESFQFLSNAAEVLAVHPDAKIFYIGSRTGRAQRIFCLEHNIPILSKLAVGNIWDGTL